MNSQVQLSDEEKKALISYHQSNIEGWKMQISELNELIGGSLYRISELTGNDNIYSSGMPLWKKVQHVLSVEKMVLTTKEIARAIITIEGNEINDMRDTVSAISATLKPKIDKSDTFDRTEINGEHYYGLIEWFDVLGDVKPQYLNVL